ncbi:MAG: ferritin-like domain-containing protein, partial [Achromobacter sp.]|nr:ferritin-like domain-containing protein [Achromobacter sp.]
KVATRILHILSKLMDRSFETVKDLNRYRKEMTALVVPKEKEIILAGA